MAWMSLPLHPLEFLPSLAFLRSFLSWCCPFFGLGLRSFLLLGRLDGPGK